MKFDRGFSTSRKKAKKGVKYIRSCFNCDCYYKAVGDTEEVCQNPNVSDYDLVIDGNNIFCTYWKPISDEEPKDENSLFIGTGRNRRL